MANERELTLSDGFMQDLAKLLEFCAEQDTNSIEIEFNLSADGVRLFANIEFFGKESEQE